MIICWVLIIEFVSVIELMRLDQALCLIIDITNMLYIPHCVEQTVAGM